MKKIKQFTGDYHWLSNFARCEINLNDKKYPSVENAYQSEKSEDPEWKELCQTNTPSSVKRESKKLKINVEEWDKRKMEVMKECIWQKFEQEPFKTLLLITYDDHIQEGNRWGDEFWGINLKTGNGQNNLGKLIMKKRSELRGILKI